MLKAELLRTLYLPTGDDHAARRWLSAASALVYTQRRLYMIADDEHHLYHVAFDAKQPRADTAPLQSVRLLPGELPENTKARKKAKPDLESLLLLPASSTAPFGTLLCLGSGGKAMRRRALCVPLGSGGEVVASGIRVHDLTEFYDTLQREFDDLNIEGAFLQGAALHLLQRGNKSERNQSACLQFKANDMFSWLDGSRRSPPKLQSCTQLDFGSICDVPLCPTDATPLPGGGSVVTLVAEDTNDSVRDGHCVASAIAVLDADHQLSVLHRLHGNPKVEGVALLNEQGARDGLSLLMVTDADDPTQAAQLLQVTIPG